MRRKGDEKSVRESSGQNFFGEGASKKFSVFAFGVLVRYLCR